MAEHSVPEHAGGPPVPRRSPSAVSRHRNRHVDQTLRLPVCLRPASPDAASRPGQPGLRVAGPAPRPHRVPPKPGDHHARDEHPPDSGDRHAQGVLPPDLFDRWRDHLEADHFGSHPASLGHSGDRDRDAHPRDRGRVRRGDRPGAGHGHTERSGRCRVGKGRRGADPRGDRRTALPHAGGPVRNARPGTWRPAKAGRRGRVGAAADFARGCSPGRGSAHSSGHGRERWSSSSDRLRRLLRPGCDGRAFHRVGGQPAGARRTSR